MRLHPFSLEIEQLETIDKEIETLSSQSASLAVGGQVINPKRTYELGETGFDPIKDRPWPSYPDYETGF